MHKIFTAATAALLALIWFAIAPLPVSASCTDPTTANTICAGPVAGASANFAARALVVRDLPFHVENPLFGAKGDGVTDDRAAIRAAIAAAKAAGAGEVWFSRKRYCVYDTLILGDGSATQYSTEAGIVLRGVGQPFPRLNSAGSPLTDAGTIIEACNGFTGTVVRVAGPGTGNALRNVAINCKAEAAIGLDLVSASYGIFDQVTIADCTDRNFRSTAVVAQTIAGSSEAIGSGGNVFNRLTIYAGVPGSVGIELTGDLTYGHNTTGHTFMETHVLYHPQGGTGIILGFTDQVSFLSTQMSSIGTPDGNSRSIKYVGGTVQGCCTFPQTTYMAVRTDLGQNGPIEIVGSIGVGHSIKALTPLDLQVIPAGPETKKITFTTFDRDGWWQENGQRIDAARRNMLPNPTFARATPSQVPITASEQELAAWGWQIVTDGAINGYSEVFDFAPGQTDVPGARRGLRLTITSASGATELLLKRQLPFVDTAAARYTSSSLWVKGDATRTFSFLAFQQFGTGGTPSAGVHTFSATRAMTTAWSYQWAGILVPDIAGKTRGTNGDDGLFWHVVLPVNTALVVEIAEPQFELGAVPTLFEVRPHYDDDAALTPTRQRQVIGAAAVGANAFTGAQTITVPSAGGALTITSTDSGAATGPNIDLQRWSATPAAFDLLTYIRFIGRDSSLNGVVYAGLLTYAKIVTDGAETGAMSFQVAVSGAMVDGLFVSDGVGVGTNVTHGTGTVNATVGYRVNGTAGINTTATVRNAAGTGTCTITFTGGLATATTC